MLDNELKDSVDIKDCSEEATHLEVVTKKIDLNIKGKQHHIPSRHEIMKASKFGKPSIDHSFTSEACFEHVMIFILKSEYISRSDQDSLLNSLPYSNI